MHLSDSRAASRPCHTCATDLDMSHVIGVVLKPGAPEALEDLKTLMRELPNSTLLAEREGHHSLHGLSESVQAVDAARFAECDLVVVLGGDGTLIHAATLLREAVVPILGINLGHIGFLTEVTREEMAQAIHMALAGDLPHSDRMRLDVEVRRGDEVLLARRILNDVTAGPPTLARVSSYHVYLNGELINAIRGDGVIVSTPTGSTAYALAAGGSVLTPDLEAVAITPICAHQLTQRPLVIRPRGEIAIRLASEREVFATCDGQTGHPFRKGDEMLVRQAPVPTRILQVPWRPYFQTLRTKLRWGDGSGAA